MKTVYLCVDFILMKNNSSMFKAFGNSMTKEFEMSDLGSMTYYSEITIKLSRIDDGKIVKYPDFKNLVGSLLYLTCTQTNILYEIGLVSR